MLTTGAVPPDSLLITRLADPVWPATVCETSTVTDPVGKPLTSRAAVVQAPLLHGAVAATWPTRTDTSAPLAEQLPDTT